MMTTTTTPIAQVWDEMIELKGTLSDFLQQGLTLKFFDYDFGSRDDPLGELNVPLEALRTQDALDFKDWPLPGNNDDALREIPRGRFARLDGKADEQGGLQVEKPFKGACEIFCLLLPIEHGRSPSRPDGGPL